VKHTGKKHGEKIIFPVHGTAKIEYNIILVIFFDQINFANSEIENCRCSSIANFMKTDNYVSKYS